MLGIIYNHRYELLTSTINNRYEYYLLCCSFNNFKPVSLHLALFTDKGYVTKVVILTQPSKGEPHVRLKIPPVEAQFDWHLSPFKLSGRHCHCLYFSDLMSHFNTQELECSLVQKIKIAVVFKYQQKGLNFSTTLCHSSGKSRFILRTTNLICTCGCKGLYKSYRTMWGASCTHRWYSFHQMSNLLTRTVCSAPERIFWN